MVTRANKKRVARSGFNLHPEFYSRGMIFIISPLNITANNLIFVGQKRVEFRH
jgi:hypothetical protein